MDVRITKEDRRAAAEAEDLRPSRAAAEAAVRTLIRWAGDDPRREGLADTPARVVRAFEEWFAAEFSAIHGADLKQKLMWPLVGKTWDWVKGEKNENVAPLTSLATHLLGE